MINIRHSSKHILYILTCIKSLKLNNKDSHAFQHLSIQTKGINSYNNTLDLNSYLYASLAAVYHILNMANERNQEYQKSISILEYESTNNQNKTTKKKLLLQKYKQRFNYQYQQDNKHKLKKLGEKKETHKNAVKANIISITYLYIIYKIIGTNNKFMTCKRFIQSFIS